MEIRMVYYTVLALFIADLLIEINGQIITQRLKKSTRHRHQHLEPDHDFTRVTKGADFENAAVLDSSTDKPYRVSNSQKETKDTNKGDTVSSSQNNSDENISDLDKGKQFKETITRTSEPTANKNIISSSLKTAKVTTNPGKNEQMKDNIKNLQDNLKHQSDIKASKPGDDRAKKVQTVQETNANDSVDPDGETKATPSNNSNKELNGDISLLNAKQSTARNISPSDHKDNTNEEVTGRTMQTKEARMHNDPDISDKEETFEQPGEELKKTKETTNHSRATVSSGDTNSTMHSTTISPISSASSSAMDMSIEMTKMFTTFTSTIKETVDTKGTLHFGVKATSSEPPKVLKPADTDKLVDTTQEPNNNPCSIPRNDGQQYPRSAVVAAGFGGMFVGGTLVFFLFYARGKCRRYVHGDYHRVPIEYDFELNPRFKNN